MKTVTLKAFSIKNSLIAVLGLLLLSSSSAQVVDIAADNFAEVDLVSSTALSDVGFELVGEDSFVREITKPIGRLHIMSLEGVKSCTGTLVREDVILTASSCLPADEIISTNFRLGYLSEEQAGEVFSVEIAPIGFNSSLGYMLLRVNSKAVTNYGFLPLYVEDAEVGSSLKLIQHALSAPMSLTEDCEITASNGEVFEHNCQSAPGASGGVLFDALGYPVGMHLEEGLGISLTKLAKSNKIIAEMYNLTNTETIDIDAIDESIGLIEPMGNEPINSESSSITSSLSSSVVEEASTDTEVSDLAPVTVETTITTTPLASTPLTSTSSESGNNTVSNNSTSNTTSSLSAPAQVVWSVLAEGAQGSAQQPSVYLIQSQRKLQEVWTIANANFTPIPTLPTVDFRNTSILAVFLGIKPSGGHSVEIATMVNKATGLDVALQINKPGAGMFATMALTSPWVMVEVSGATLSNINVIDSATGASFVTNIQ